MSLDMEIPNRLKISEKNLVRLFNDEVQHSSWINGKWITKSIHNRNVMPIVHTDSHTHL